MSRSRHHARAELGPIPINEDLTGEFGVGIIASTNVYWIQDVVVDERRRRQVTTQQGAELTGLSPQDNPDES